ncbi:hypothetical protein [Streptomyces griseus]|uniref:hypothetical protein n=1 Tax=Streptomyces griseus TaxID=1911 RepID=UPI0033CFD4E3
MPIVNAELVRVVAVYECPVCGGEFEYLADSGDLTGIPAQEVPHVCPEADS